MKLGIKKIEFRKATAAPNSFVELKIVHLSCTLEENWENETAGPLSTVKIRTEIRSSNILNDAKLLPFVGQWYVFRVTDMQGVGYIIGDDEYMPVVTLKRSIAKFNPNGYEISITYKSTKGLIPDK